MGIINGLDEYDVEMFEYGHLTTITHVDTWALKLYIPKLMATFPFGPPKETRLVFNNNIFLNDDSCKPSTGKNITTQNYVTVERHYYTNFNVRGNWETRGKQDVFIGNMAVGTKFIVQLMDRNIRDMRISQIL